jgi:hypothetical protein
MPQIACMTARIALLVAVFSTGVADAPVQAQQQDMQRKMELEIEREFFLGYSGLTQICGERNPAQKAKLDANYANKIATASPDIQGWTKTTDFKARLKKRLAEQRVEIKQPDEASMLTSICEDMSK